MSDFTISELKKYNGVTDEHILFALNGTVSFSYELQMIV